MMSHVYVRMKVMWRKWKCKKKKWNDQINGHLQFEEYIVYIFFFSFFRFHLLTFAAVMHSHSLFIFLRSLETRACTVGCTYMVNIRHTQRPGGGFWHVAHTYMPLFYTWRFHPHFEFRRSLFRNPSMTIKAIRTFALNICV